MSITITDTNIVYGLLYGGYNYYADIEVTTAGSDLDHINLLSQGSLVRIDNTANRFYLVSNTFINIEVVLQAIDTNTDVSPTYPLIIDIKDRWKPYFANFSIPLVSSSREVPLSYTVDFLDGDTTAYQIGLSEVNDSSTVTSWGLHTTYTFDSDGNKLLYAWVKDDSDNISTVVSVITYIDTGLPEVQFTLPATTISSEVAVSIIANDVSSIKYAITLSDIVPTVWQDNQPTIINVDTDGEYTYYCWVKDIADNIAYDTATIVVNLARPTLNVTCNSTFTTPTVNFIFTAEDIYGIKGYYVNHINVYDKLDLSINPPNSYSFADLEQGVEYNYTLYFWAENNLNNVCLNPIEVPITILIPDNTKPVIISFTMPVASDVVEVPITNLTVSDNTAVIGYFISESSITPVYNTPGWEATAPTSFTFSSTGLKRAHLWVKDTYNNISDISWCNVAVADTIKPIIKAFILPTSYNLLNVPITSFTTIDNIAISGYYISEDTICPDAESYLWLSSKPTSFMFYSYGMKTLYAWVKDNSGNISDVVSANVSIEETILAIQENKLLSGKEILIQHLSPKTITIEAIYKYISTRLSIKNDYTPIIECTAFTSISMFRAVALNASGIFHCSYDTDSPILGISMSEGTPGNSIQVQYKDIINNSLWNLAVGKHVYLATNGNISQDDNYNRIIGIALSPTSILLKL